LAFIWIAVFTMPLWQNVSGEKSVLLIPLAAIGLAAAVVLAAKPVKADGGQTDLIAFTPDPHNDKMILIQGWNEAELRQLLADFIEADLAAFAAFRIEVRPRVENLFELTFPEDIHPTEFLSLINYLAYPINCDLNERSIVVAGKTSLNSDFDGLPRSLEGQKAILYLPDRNEPPDVIYLQTESGATMAKSFNEGTWRQVEAPRLPSAVEALLSFPFSAAAET
jgi:hypothetical protein